jgi:hypothetical protein
MKPRSQDGNHVEPPLNQVIYGHIIGLVQGEICRKLGFYHYFYGGFPANCPVNQSNDNIIEESKFI